MITPSKKYPGKYTVAASFRPETLTDRQVFQHGLRCLALVYLDTAEHLMLDQLFESNCEVWAQWVEAKAAVARRQSA